MGIEPTQVAWKATVLPLNYTRNTYWSGKRDSNPQPSPWQGDALAIELFPHSLPGAGDEI